MQRSETVRADGATSALVSFGMAVGELRVTGGATELMEADFIYDEELAPQIDYRVENGQGVLNVEQESQRGTHATRNEWDIRLNNDLPIDLRAGVAAAGATLNLDDLTLSVLELNMAAGDASVSAAGDQPHFEHASVDSASGDVQLRLAGSYRSMSSVTARSAAGAMHLDLIGTWERDVDVNVETVAGQVEIRVPSSVGVSVQTTSMVGRVSLEGFNRHETGHVNAAFATSPTTLRLRITTVSGAVTVTEIA